LREYNQAKSLLAHAFQVFDRIKDERRMAKALRGLGLVAYACGSPDEARRLHGLALERLTRIGDERDSAKTRFCQAFIALTPGEAENLYREALEVFERLGDSVGVAECCQQLGTIARSIGRPEDSEAFSKRALELLSSLGIRTDVADVRLSLLG
jgi:tetratricopeptide (TPR) repeat protein